jgi:hypothetical protein
MDEQAGFGNVMAASSFDAAPEPTAVTRIR